MTVYSLRGRPVSNTKTRSNRHLPFLCFSLGSSQPVSLRTTTGALEWSLTYIRGCSRNSSSSQITKVVALILLVVKEVEGGAIVGREYQQSVSPDHGHRYMYCEKYMEMRKIKCDSACCEVQWHVSGLSRTWQERGLQASFTWLAKQTATNISLLTQLSFSPSITASQQSIRPLLRIIHKPHQLPIHLPRRRHNHMPAPALIVRNQALGQLPHHLHHLPLSRHDLAHLTVLRL